MNVSDNNTIRLSVRFPDIENSLSDAIGNAWTASKIRVTDALKETLDFYNSTSAENSNHGLYRQWLL